MNFAGYPAYLQPTYQSGTNDIQGVCWVSGVDEVRATTVPFGRQMFMHNDEPIFYIKSSNGTIEAFKFEETTIPTPENCVTREEFDELRSKYESIVQSIQQSQPQQPQPSPSNASNAGIPGFSGTGQATVYPDNSGFGNDEIPAQQPIG